MAQGYARNGAGTLGYGTLNVAGLKQGRTREKAVGLK